MGMHDIIGTTDNPLVHVGDFDARNREVDDDTSTRHKLVEGRRSEGLTSDSLEPSDGRVADTGSIRTELELDAQQRSAVELCTDMSLSKRIVAITGAAGTGKTTIIKQAYERLRHIGINVAICAPTGKAARRIREATGIAAVTIHRLLEFPKPWEYDERTGQPVNPSVPRRHKSNPLPYAAILVDEYAMVGQELNRHLVDALPSGAVLRVFGDNNQLAPIEGREYQDVKFQESAFQYYLKNFPSVTLTHVYRQQEGSGILSNATRIIRGITPNRTTDFDVSFTERPVKAVEEFAYRNTQFSTARAQIITTTNKGWIGTYELNQRLQQVLNPSPTDSFDPPRHKWQAEKGITISLGDKVVFTENAYDLRDHYERYTDYREDGSPKQNTYIDCPAEFTVLNGEVGKVTEISRDQLTNFIDYILVDVGDRIVQVPYMIHEWSPKKNSIFPVSPMKGVDLGYVLTTHKCQGSEYDEVVYVLNKSTKFMQNRRNLYTAVTRARKMVTLITDRISLSTSLWRKE